MTRQRCRAAKARRNAEAAARKKILAYVLNEVGPESWVEIDPHKHEGGGDDCFAVVNPEIDSPPDDLELKSCGMLAVDSKVYFVGGVFIKNYEVVRDTYSYTTEKIIYSNKIYTYDLLARKWDMLPCKLNVARSNPLVLLVCNVIYVIGGTMSLPKPSTNNNKAYYWMECLNLVDVGKDKTLEFLPAPPDNLIRYAAAFQFGYDPRNEIVFVMPDNLGSFSFNCVSKTWDAYSDGNISKMDDFTCYRVAVVDHLIFLFYDGSIYAYDLEKNERVMSKCLPPSECGKSEPENELEFNPAYMFLERVGIDTLVLIRCDEAMNGIELHLFKFQIKNEKNLELLLVGRGCHFLADGLLILDNVKIPTA